MSTISTLSRADLARTNDVSTARTAYEQQSRGAAKAHQQINSKPGDRVSISQEARQLATPSDDEDAKFAKLALKAVAPMAPDRLDEIRSRLASGFYTSPAVSEAIVSSLADELVSTVV